MTDVRAFSETRLSDDRSEETLSCTKMSMACRNSAFRYHLTHGKTTIQKTIGISSNYETVAYVYDYGELSQITCWELVVCCGYNLQRTSPSSGTATRRPGRVLIKTLTSAGGGAVVLFRRHDLGHSPFAGHTASLPRLLLSPLSCCLPRKGIVVRGGCGGYPRTVL